MKASFSGIVIFFCLRCLMSENFVMMTKEREFCVYDSVPTDDYKLNTDDILNNFLIFIRYYRNVTKVNGTSDIKSTFMCSTQNVIA